MRSVLINGLDIGEFVEIGDLSLGGGLYYKGKALEDDGKKIESHLKQLQIGQKVKIKDSDKTYINGIYKIIKKDGKWKEEVFKFVIEFQRL